MDKALEMVDGRGEGLVSGREARASAPHRNREESHDERTDVLFERK